MIRVRTVLPSDAEAIRDVCVRNAFPASEPDDMRRAWASHPFRREFDGVPNGWVLEKEDGNVVGTLSNVHMMYELDGHRLKAATTGSWCVDVPYRNGSLPLMNSYFSQKGIDLLVIGSASAVTSRLMSAMKVQRIPSPDFDLSYFWVTKRQAFVAAAMRKRRIPAAGVLSSVPAIGLWLLDICSRRAGGGQTAVKQLKSFGPEFDAFWGKLRQGPPRLRAVRTATALTWRFGRALQQNRAVLLGAFAGQELLGYIVLREFVRAHLGLRQFVIVDIQALDDSEQVLLDLMTAAIDATRLAGAAALEWQGCNTAKRKLALSLNPRSYRYPIWQLFYKASHPSLVSTLATPDVWDFSLFDEF